MTLNAVIYRDESGVYCAEIPSLPGCCSDGDNRANFDNLLRHYSRLKRILGEGDI
jgi:hypothetical protein